MSWSQKRYDLMLCGGGVIGLSIAYQCARNGWRVLVVEAGSCGRESSWAGAGILPAGATTQAEDPIEQLRALSHRLHFEWAERLLKETGIDNEYRTCGGVYIARTAAERATLSANCHWWRDHGIDYEEWSIGDLLRRVTALHGMHYDPKIAHAWYVPADCRLRNPRHLQALIEACTSAGVDLMEECRIERLETHEDRLVAAHSKTMTFHADRFCITSGAWASGLLKELKIEAGILPVRGQMVLYKLPTQHFLPVLNEGHRYLVPRDDGHVLAGSCEEEVGFDRSNTEMMIDELRSWAEGLCPVLSSQAQVVQCWAGLRPGSFDSLPYLGTLYPFQNAFIAAGHFRHGLHWSTATALLMHQWMAGIPTSIDLSPFRVQRGHTAVWRTA